MNRKYRKEYKELEEIPDNITDIKIVPANPYNGFWGKNGYRAFDFIFGDHSTILGWKHFECDVIHLNDCNPFEKHDFFYGLKNEDMKIDCDCKDNFIRIFSYGGLEIKNETSSEISIINKKIKEK